MHDVAPDQQLLGPALDIVHTVARRVAVGSHGSDAGEDFLAVFKHTHLLFVGSDLLARRAKEQYLVALVALGHRAVVCPMLQLVLVEN